jgi:muramoyltetrapeptide carboxypeptidase
MLAQTGATTWAGPVVNADFGVDTRDGGEVDDIMLDCFADLLSGQGEGAAGRCPGWRAAQWQAPAQGLLCSGGATLWGGNLAVLVSLLGTPYFPQVEGGILFLEDVGEHPYKIERMLNQLLLAGVLQKQKAIVWGSSPNSSSPRMTRASSCRP